MKEVAKEMAIAIAKCLSEINNIPRSLIPIDKPTPSIGDINGEINIAPIMTAGEFKSNPKDATIIEHINSQALAPSIFLLFRISRIAPSRSIP